MGSITQNPHRPSKGAPLLIKVLFDSIDSSHSGEPDQEKARAREAARPVPADAAEAK